jgi:hypothetical protein
VPVLVSVLDSSHPAGEDFEVVLDALKALGILGDARAVPAIDRTIRKRGWRGRRRLRQVKAAGVRTLLGMTCADAGHALAQAAATGDRMLKRAVRDAGGGGARG